MWRSPAMLPPVIWALVLGLTGWSTHIGYFYATDASYLLFETLSTGIDTLLVHTYPTRSAALLLTLGPASLSDALGMPVPTSAAVYATCFQGLLLWPLTLVWRARHALPESTVLLLSAFLGVACLSTFGFASEVQVVACLLVVLLLSLHRPTSVRRRRWEAALVGAMVFSHDVALLCVPGVLWLARRLRPAESATSATAWARQHLAIACLVAVGCWLAARHLLPPDDPSLPATLQANARNLWHGYRVPQAWIGLLLTAWLAIGPEVWTRMPPRWRMAVMACLVTGVLLLTQHLVSTLSLGHHYDSRAWLMCCCMALPWVCARPRPVAGHQVMAVALTSLALGVAMGLELRGWPAYRDQLVAAASWRHLATPLTMADLRRYEWPWVTPYQLALWTRTDQPRQIMVRVGQDVGPLACARASQHMGYRRLLTAPEQAALRQTTCAKQARFAPPPQP